MPQGGVDEGEDYISAMKRELLKKLVLKILKLLKEIEKIYQYEFQKI